MSDIILKEAAPPPDISAEIRAEVAVLMRDKGLSQAAVARDAAISGATFSAWFNGTYQGRNDQVAEKVRIWIASRKVAEQTRSTMSRGPGFIATESAKKFMGVLAHAQFAPDFVVIDGAPGVGKTESCKEYRRSNPHVFVVTAEPAWISVRMMIQRIAAELGISERYNLLTSSIVKRLQGCDSLLIVDEANNLSSPAIDQLRTFHDLADCGVALVGNATVYSRLEGDGRKTQFAQLFSRVGLRHSQGTSLIEDVNAIGAGWGISGEAEMELLRTIARSPGALRSVTKTLRMATMKPDGGLSEGEIKRAWTRLSAGRLKAV